MKNNKKTAEFFLNMVIAGKIREAFSSYVAVNFFHHNPYFEDKPEALMNGMIENHEKFPQKLFEIKHIVGEGNLVIAHSRLQMKTDMPEMAVVHVFRFNDDGKIAELWDVGQVAPIGEEKKNEMF